MLTRRALLAASPLLAAPGPTPIAAIVTAYYRNSHADVFIGNMLRGYYWDGKPHPSGLKIAAMYLAQKPANDIGLEQAAKYGIPMKPTVTEAMPAGIRGVALIGEHGDYPNNEKGQKLYPRHELMEQIVANFRATGRALPVFVDKHFSTEWRKARQMFDWSRELKFPLIAGTSLTLTWRRPALELALETPIKRMAGYFYGGKEAYGYHGVEVMQSMLERRKGGETGVASVQCLDGAEVWKWTAANPWARNLLEESMRHDDTLKRGRLEDVVKDPSLFLITYRDGLLCPLYMLTGFTEQCGFAAEIEGQSDPAVCCFLTQWGRPWSHGNGLSYWVERTIVEHKEFYPPERTLLATGIIEAVMDSSFQKGQPINTPRLAVKYRAQRESRFMRGPLPPYDRIRV